MGFICNYSKNYVEKQECVLVPAVIRKVKYYNQLRPKYEKQDPILSETTEGWEVVKEVKVAKLNYEKYMMAFKQDVLPEPKNVYLFKTPKKYEKFDKVAARRANIVRKKGKNYVQP